MKAETEQKRRSKLGRAAETLRQRTRGIREYEVIRESEERLKLPRDVVSETWIYESEYDRAFRLKEELVRRFEGKPLEKAIPGKVVSNDYGDCYCVVDERNTRFKRSIMRKAGKRFSQI